jgi:phosphate transport system protein
MMSRHTDREYEAELLTLRDRILKMAGRVEDMIARAVRAFTSRDVSLAKAVISDDDLVNTDEVEIDEMCLAILARRQPLASDLRFIATTLKMVTDLERVGDLAVNVCERAEAMAAEQPLPAWSGADDMGRIVQEMLKEAMDALVARDAARARKVIDRDEDVDELYHRSLRELFKLMASQPTLLQSGLHAQAVAKHLERIGDHATNLAEEVVYLVEATDIRHAGKRSTPTPPKP